jgi:hypothetical protein
MVILTNTVRLNGPANGLANHFSALDLSSFQKLHLEGTLPVASEEIIGDLRMVW